MATSAMEAMEAIDHVEGRLDRNRVRKLRLFVCTCCNLYFIISQKFKPFVCFLLDALQSKHSKSKSKNSWSRLGCVAAEIAVLVLFTLLTNW